MLGGFGGEGEKGWTALGARYDGAAAQYRPGNATMNVDYDSIVVSGDVAFTVAIDAASSTRRLYSVNPM